MHAAAGADAKTERHPAETGADEEVVVQPNHDNSNANLAFHLSGPIPAPVAPAPSPPHPSSPPGHGADAGAGNFEDSLSTISGDWDVRGEAAAASARSTAELFKKAKSDKSLGAAAAAGGGGGNATAPDSRHGTDRGSAHSRHSRASGISEKERRGALLGMMGFGWTRCLLYNLCVAGVVVAVVVPVTMLTGGDGNSGGAGGAGAGGVSTAGAGGGTDDTTPAARRRSLRSAILGLPRLPAGNATAAALSDPRSAQSRALEWLAADDPLSVDPSDAARLAPRFALSTLFYSARGRGWDLNLGFLSGEEVCSWNRVVEEYGLGFPYKGAFCFDGGKLDSLVLPMNNLAGPIPPELSLLSDLDVLHLYSNSLSGPIPPALTNLTKLTILDLHGNRLVGAMPESMGDDLANLNHLDLSHNELTGEIPWSLEGLVTREGSRLLNLDLSRNELTGTIHAGWFRGDTGAPLQWLSVSGNYLSGTIPESHSVVTEDGAATLRSSQLTDVWMGGNFLTGTLPVSLFSVHRNLGALGLSNNRLAGTLPADYGLGGGGGSANLRTLQLGRNKLRGTLPAAVGAMALLEFLDLRRNRLTGSVPEEAFGRMGELRELDLGRNRLVGQLPESLGNATALEVLRLERNRFSGEVPQSWERLTKLETLLLANNSIVGNISFICKNSTSIGLFLADCYGFNSEVTCSCCTACCSDKEGPKGEINGCFLVEDNIFQGQK